jgi:hypothetical protein
MYPSPRLASLRKRVKDAEKGLKKAISVIMSKTIDESFLDSILEYLPEYTEQMLELHSVLAKFDTSALPGGLAVDSLLKEEPTPGGSGVNINPLHALLKWLSADRIDIENETGLARLNVSHVSQRHRARSNYNRALRESLQNSRRYDNNLINYDETMDYRDQRDLEKDLSRRLRDMEETGDFSDNDTFSEPANFAMKLSSDHSFTSISANRNSATMFIRNVDENGAFIDTCAHKRQRLLPSDDLKKVHDVWSLNIQNRVNLLNLWFSELRSKVYAVYEERMLEHSKAQSDFRLAMMQHDAAILRNAAVIGMTTTVAARMRQMLGILGVRTVIIEEAAEVLEGHVLASIPITTEHLILIG